MRSCYQMRSMSFCARRGPSSEMHVAAVVVLLLLVVLVPGHHAYLDDGDNVIDVEALEKGSSCHFRMIPPVVPESPEERLEHYRALEAKDLARHRQMAERTRRRQLAASSTLSEEPEPTSMPSGPKLISTSASDMTELMSSTSTFELPMRSALNIVKVGMYLVTVHFGTPPLPYSMALDTANDLTWLNCRLRGHRHHHRKTTGGRSLLLDDAASSSDKVKYTKNWYRPARSRSWRRYRCHQADSCGLFPHTTCKTPNRNESCTYVSWTQDGTSIRGIYGSETATVAVSGGRMARLPGLVLGCSTYESGGSVDKHDGVLTLGNQDVSFGIVAAKHFEGRFSFCLLPALSSGNTSSYLTFGPNPAMATGACETGLFVYENTPLLGLFVTGLFINGKRLDIPPEVWSYKMKGGLAIDTGTTLTALVEPAYGIVTRAITKHLDHLKKEKIQGFDYCYRWTFTGDGVDPANNVTIPKLEIEFEGGGRLDVGARGVVLPEVAPGTVCLAFRRGELGPSILGNMQMQEHIWEVDHFKSVIRFKKDNCLNHNLPPPPPNPSSPTAKNL